MAAHLDLLQPTNTDDVSGTCHRVYAMRSKFSFLTMAFLLCNGEIVNMHDDKRELEDVL